MKKILIVTPNLSTGGTNSSLSSVYEEIKGRFDVDVFAMSHHGHAKISFLEKLLPEYKLLSLWNCVYAELEKKNEKILAFVLKVFRRLSIRFGCDLDSIIYKLALGRINIRKYDVVISFQEGSATKFVYQSKAMQKYAWVHCDYSNWHPTIKSEERAIYQRFSQIVCVSKYTAQVFNSIFKLSNNAISINNIQDIDKIRKLANEHIKDQRWDGKEYSIISVGRINPVKHFREIPAIAQALKSKGYLFKWYIIGPVFSQEEMQKIAEGIEAYNLVNTVIYLGPKSNPYPYFAKADLYVCLSESEACPMVFNEAKCFGTPVITTDFGSSYEFITSKNDGIIVKREHLADSIASYIGAGHTKHQPSNVVEENNKKIQIQLYKLLNFDDK